MGNKTNERDKSKPKNEIETLFAQTYKKLRVNYNKNELEALELKYQNAKKNFSVTFDYILIFNSIVFNENFQILYDNYSNKIELHSKTQPTQLFKVLLFLENEIDIFDQGTKFEFESLFTIIFEKLEIGLLLFIDLTNSQYPYLKDFILQIYENAILYKFNRRCDCLYFILPNNDFVIKNHCTLTYIECKTETNLDKSNEIFNDIFKIKNFKKFILSRNEVRQTHNFIDKFLTYKKPLNSLSFMYFNFNCEEGELFASNEKQFKLFEQLIQGSRIKIFYFFLDKTFKYNENLNIFLQKILSLFDISERSINCLKIKMLLSTNDDSFQSDLFYPNIINLILKYYSKKEKVEKQRKELIFEFHEIKGIKKVKGDFIVHFSRFLFHEEKSSLIHTIEYGDKFKKCEEYVSFSKAIEPLDKIKRNKKIMKTIRSFLTEKKVIVYKVDPLPFRKNNNLFYQTGTITGKGYKKHFKKYFFKYI